MSVALTVVPRRVSSLAAIMLCLLAAPALARKPVPPPPEPPPPPPGVTVRVSVAADGTQGNGTSSSLAMTPDARYVAFSSGASNLVANDTNGVTDIFVHDRATGAIDRVSVASNGSEANNHSYDPAMSADGRYVLFESTATNLVPGAQSSYSHVYLHDRTTRTTERISVASDGTPGNQYSDSGSVSADGRYVMFSSYASNLVAGDTNANMDVFVRDRTTGTLERVSVAADGTQGNGRSYGKRITPDGRYVSYMSDATNLVAGDTNQRTDVFLYDRQTGTPERISVGTGGVQANDYSTGGTMTPNGRWVLFTSAANNLVAGDTNFVYDVFLRDRATGTTERVSLANAGTQANWGDSFEGSISDDGNVVAFNSYDDNLVPTDGDPNYNWGDVFVRIRSTGTTEHISISASGSGANGDSGFYGEYISADGRFVAFDSWASNLVADDTNALPDIFVRERYSSP